MVKIAGIVGLLTILIGAIPAVAEVTSDTSTGTIVNQNGTEFNITGGTTVGGRNLFHSFDLFDVPTGGAANFLNDPSIVNIFSRVTGGKISAIGGLLRSQGSANFFLMNPSGIVFKEEASLDVKGSFVATTANGLQFPGGGIFAMTSSVSPQNALLSVDPSAFLFSQVPRAIETRSSVPVGISNVGSLPGQVPPLVRGLKVQDGRSLLLLGGDVTIDSSGLNAFGGRIEVGSVASAGSVGLSIQDSNLQLNFPREISRADAAITSSRLDVVASGGGNVNIYAGNVEIAKGSLIAAGVGQNLGNLDRQAGDININSTGVVRLSDSSNIVNSIFGRIGNSGNVTLAAKQIEILNASVIGNVSLGQSDAGSISLEADDTILMAGRGVNQGRSGILSSVLSLELLGVPDLVGSGNGGDINLKARSITLADEASIFSSSVLAPGRSGNIQVTVTDTLETRDGAFISTFTGGRGDAGNITIIANTVNFAGVNSTGFRGGVSSGVVTVPVATTARKGGEISIKTGTLNITDGAAIASNVQAGGVGTAGSIDIVADSVALSSGGQVQSFLEAANPTTGVPGGKGKSGNVSIEARRSFSATGVGANGERSAVITGVDLGSEGDGGNIQIKAPTLQLSQDAVITAETFGIGRGGNISIEANRLTGVVGGQISSGSGRENQPGLFGRAGDITVEADLIEFDGSGELNRSGIFSETSSKSRAGDVTVTTSRLRILNGAAISSGASGSGSLGGDGGSLTINAAESIELIGRGRRASVLATESNFDFSKGLPDPNDPVIAGQLSVTTKDLIIRDGAFISTLVTPKTIGTGGNIVLNVNRLQISNAEISAPNFGLGKAGNINVRGNQFVLRNRSQISTISDIGDGGDITLTANTIVVLEESDIVAFAPAGKGGNITFNTRAFLSDPLYRATAPTTDRAALEALLNNDQVDVNASGTVSGSISGVPDITFLQNSLTQLSQTAIDTNALLANSCIVRNSQNGAFYITGTGGLPTNPDDISSYATGTVHPIPSPWKRGDEIVEPQGVYQLPDGRLILSRDCS